MAPYMLWLPTWKDMRGRLDDVRTSEGAPSAREGVEMGVAATYGYVAGTASTQAAYLVAGSRP